MAKRIAVSALRKATDIRMKASSAMRKIHSSLSRNVIGLPQSLSCRGQRLRSVARVAAAELRCIADRADAVNSAAAAVLRLADDRGEESVGFERLWSGAKVSLAIEQAFFVAACDEFVFYFAAR